MNERRPLIPALSLAATLLAGCAAEEEPISFSKQVQPILAANCMECHAEGGAGHKEAGLLMDSYEHLMAGTQYGPIIIPGDGLSSVLNQVVEGRVDPSIRMPHGGKQMTETETSILRKWVDQGAKNN